jgi:7-cyano-7-deazaguanine tRNA-ribosyltransferase
MVEFKLKHRDLLGRVGVLKTKSGNLETPLLFPVINPMSEVITPREMSERFGCQAVITNAYIIKRHLAKEAEEKGVHALLDFKGGIMTDSGAYQILQYGKIEASPEEIIRFQESIDTDIATILDVPTGWRVSRSHAEYTVNETIKRAKKLPETKTRDDILWVGPIQGGEYLDLIEKSAREMGDLPFDIHALGSPTQVMEQYRFDLLVDMIMAAKTSLPPERPLHLFGAGHPLVFALAVALGCDFFDSAAYALYAREDRYMTEYGTMRLGEVEYFPCSCPACVGRTPKEVRDELAADRTRVLAMHNLYVCMAEINRVKQAIISGRLWEYLRRKSQSHPALFQALKRLSKYAAFLEEQTPLSKRSGLFFFDSVDLVRPEVVRHTKKLENRYLPPKKAEFLFLLPQTVEKPFHKTREFRKILKILRKEISEKPEIVHFCFYAAPFGVVPIELDETYPLSQYEIALPLDMETKLYVAEQVAKYIERSNYKNVFFLEDQEVWGKTVTNVCRKACKDKGIGFKVLGFKKWRAFRKLAKEIGRTLINDKG